MLPIHTSIRADLKEREQERQQERQRGGWGGGSRRDRERKERRRREKQAHPGLLTAYRLAGLPAALPEVSQGREGIQPGPAAGVKGAKTTLARRGPQISLKFAHLWVTVH